MTQWVKLATYSTGFEADIARATLEDAGIPVMVRGNQVGAFGGGFQGPVVGGVDLHVPDDALDRAHDLVDTDEIDEDDEDDD